MKNNSGIISFWGGLIALVIVAAFACGGIKDCSKAEKALCYEKTKDITCWKLRTAP